MIAIGAIIIMAVIVSAYTAYCYLDSAGRSEKPTVYERWEQIIHGNSNDTASKGE